jgi:hypothetical protein
MNRLLVSSALLLLLSFACQRKPGSLSQGSAQKPDTTANLATSHSWVAFSGLSHRIEFQYPSRYHIQVKGGSDRFACDSTITIGYTQAIPADTAQPLQFIDIVRIYQTTGSFTNIADQEGFENGFENSRAAKDSTRDRRTPSPLDWIIRSAGDPRQAQLLQWRRWVGLKGESTVMYFRREGGSGGVGEFTQYLLFRTQPDGCRVVVSYFDGLQVPYVGDPQDPGLKLSEEEFQRIVLSIKLHGDDDIIYQ